MHLSLHRLKYIVNLWMESWTEHCPTIGQLDSKTWAKPGAALQTPLKLNHLFPPTALRQYVIVIKNFLNPEGHQNGSKVTAILVNE